MTPDDVCITCGDMALPLEVVRVDGRDALCRAADGGTEVVAVELVAPVAPGDRLLVHARVAIERLSSANVIGHASCGESSLRGDRG